MCLNPHLAAKSANSAEANCKPPSERIRVGTLWLAKQLRKTEVTSRVFKSRFGKYAMLGQPERRSMVSVVEEDVRRHILEWEIRWRVREEWFRGEAREVFLALGAGSDSGLNVVVDARPID